MKTQTASITGMSCTACEYVVTKRITQIPDVHTVTVDVQNGTALITSENGVTQDTIKEVLKDTHYSVTSI